MHLLSVALTAIRCRSRPPPHLATLAPTRSVVINQLRSSPRRSRAMAVSAVASNKGGDGAPRKRSAPSSPLQDDDARKLSKTVREDIIDDDDDGIFDDEALIEATMAAEKEDALLRSSQSTSTTSKPVSSSHSTSSSQTSMCTPVKPHTSAAGTTPKAASQTALTGIAPKVNDSNSSTLRHGDDNVEKQTMDEEWYERLQGEMTKPYFRELKSFLQAEAHANKTIYPPANLIHSWSRLTPLSTVKVVVVGQDPYHGPKQACGHSFSVPKGVPVPGSLQNIFKELTNEYGTGFSRPSHGCLDEWARQGVLLLNACLTVQANQAGSHHKKGWEPFTQAILRAVAADAANGVKPSVKTSAIASMFSKAASKPSNGSIKPEEEGRTMKPSSASKGVVFLAWGLPAAKTLAEAGITEKSPNTLLLKSPHPSPLSAHRGFLGNGHFKKANDWLENEARYGRGGGIDWTRL